jgi:amidohydrolase
VAVIGELDGLCVPDHPSADPSTGAAHACGHNAQITHLLALAKAFKEVAAEGRLAGRIVFFAVPAEEYPDVSWALEQRRRGVLEFFGGKQELLRLGEFDGIDIAVMAHAVGRQEQTPLGIAWQYNGFVSKEVSFVGKATHAAASPHLGVNALNAAALAIQAVNARRETFRDDDHVRVHAIMSRGGAAINVVPADVRLEAFVRAATNEAMLDVSAGFDQAMFGAGQAIGADVEIRTLTGYMPLHVHPELGALFRNNAIELLGPSCWGEIPHAAASTDAGDVGHLLPLLHPLHGGCTGANHSADFRVVDPDAAYVAPAIALAWTVVDLLANDATVGRQIVDAWRPPMTRDGYLDHVRRVDRIDTKTAGCC